MPGMEIITGMARGCGENETMAISSLNDLYGNIKKQIMRITAASKVSDSDTDARGNEGTRSRQWGSESSRSEGPANARTGRGNCTSTCSVVEGDANVVDTRGAAVDASHAT